MRRFAHIGAGLLCLLIQVCLSADEPAKPAPVTFEQQVLPILKSRCIRCHAGAEPQAGLRLLTRKDIYQGGDSGPAMRLNAAESSLLWEKLASNLMPKEGPPLSADEKGLIRTWINEGAKSTDGTAIDESPTADESHDGAGDFWSFRPPQRPSVPEPKDVSRILTPVDAFIVARLETEGLSLSPGVGREKLLRRVTFDLIGLPPTPEELHEFLNDSDPLAYENLVERLLASPHYGERWGRHWLDLAGYADSAGVLAEDRPLPTMFRYRDYVIRALNQDKAYDRFLQEQIAGDELSNYWQAHDTLDRLPEDVIEGVIATGYLRCAADSSRPDFSTIKNADALYFYPTLNDTLQIVASSTMGLTLQCARCHSHKYDPIPQTEYFRMQSIFMSAFRPQQWVPQMDRKIEVATAAQKKVAAEHNGLLETEITKLRGEIEALKTEFRTKFFEQRLATLPEPIRADVRQAVEKSADNRTDVEKYLADKFLMLLKPGETTILKELSDQFPEFKSGLDERNAKIAEQERRRMLFDEIRATYDLPGAFTTPLLKRGDPLTPGAPVEPGVLTALHTPEPFQWSPPAAEAKTTGRRLAFARWLTQPRHPLTARVMVNRVWKQHFGEGLVSTPEEFGNLGAAPSHPELLDWLATEFVREGWSLKQLHRQIVLSSVYQQDSHQDEVAHAQAISRDPNNRLLWRQRLRRLEAEPIRDALLSVSSTLDTNLYGSATPLGRQPDGSVIALGNGDRRRSIYLQILRLNPLDTLKAFDQPIMEINCTDRRSSTVSTQALLMLNSEVIGKTAAAFAQQLLEQSTEQPLVSLAIEKSFSRKATPEEINTLQDFLAQQTDRHIAGGQAVDLARMSAWTDLCQMLLAANEFVYVD